MNLPADPQREELVERLLRAATDALARYSRRPVATYRLQLNNRFGFDHAAEIVPYLHQLGISDLYASPVLRAAPGSMHGYDVVDHHELNPELGGAEAFERISAALARRGMGLVVDFVPNHMAVGSDNPMWMDVLENGPSSVYAHFFDIDWKPIKEELENRVLLAVLGDQYGTALEKGDLRLSFENGGFQLHYYDQRFPVNPRQYPQILRCRLEELERALPPEDVHFQDLLSIISALEKLPPRTEQDPVRIAERHREKEVIKRRIIALCEASPVVRDFVEENVRRFNGAPGDPRSFDLLDALLRDQAYRLAHWRVAAEEINYRRFFDINGLAAIRMEDPRVMQRAHALVFRLIGEGKIGGLRIDHPDGLYGPADYFARLQEEFVLTVCRRLLADEQGEEGLDERWAPLEALLRERVRAEAARGPVSPLFRPLYVVVEKILTHDERMPTTWAVHGSSGYDFMKLVNGLLVEPASERAMDETFSRFTGLRFDYQELVYQKRRQTMGESMSSEINVLARQLNRISEHDRRTRDFTLNSLKRALIEVIACFPVYRTYVSSDGAPAEEHDRRYVEHAVRRAKRKNPTVNATIFNFLRDVLLGEVDALVTPQVRQERLEFVLKLQQVTAPVMAKSVEDTVFYVYNRLVSLNEVGGEPDTFGVDPQRFHAANRERGERWPYALNATSTHDTKRSEDVRARIDVLSEMPGEWRRRLGIWSRLNRRHKVRVGDAVAPDRNEELLLYQTLVGAWPFGTLEGAELQQFTSRIQAYMLKAIKEAKVNTSWVNPDEEWERAVDAFVAAVLDPARSERFWGDFLAFHRPLARAGAFNSLSQLLLKIVSPGAPDFYQGGELWDFSLVDPDNRRPVDFALRRERLAELDAAIEGRGRGELSRELVGSLEDGRIKLFVTSQALRLRQRLTDLFSRGAYLPLAVEGERARHCLGVARQLGEMAVLALAPRLTIAMSERARDLAGEVWSDTRAVLPEPLRAQRWVDVLTGERLPPISESGELPLRAAFTGVPIVLAIPEELAAVLIGFTPPAEEAWGAAEGEAAGSEAPGLSGQAG